VGRNFDGIRGANHGQAQACLCSVEYLYVGYILRVWMILVLNFFTQMYLILE